MKNINKAKVTTVVLSTLAVASMVGSVTGTVAWYQYSTRASVAYSGASAKCTENLRVRIFRPSVEEDLENGVRGDNGYKTEWRSDLRIADVQNYLNDVRTNADDASLKPVTSGELDEYKVATSFYSNPVRYHGSTESWGKATLDDYVELPLQFRVEDNNGNSAVEREFLAKNLYLADLTMKSTSPDGKKDITDALRVSFDATSDVTFSTHGKDVDVYSKLDMDGDGEFDQIDGNGTDYEFNDREEIVYGDKNKVAKSTKILKADFGPSWVIDGADTGIETVGNRVGTYYHTAELAYQDVKSYTLQDNEGATFDFVEYDDNGTPAYKTIGAGHIVTKEGDVWKIDGVDAINDPALTSSDALIYKLTDSDDNELLIAAYADDYAALDVDVAVEFENGFKVDGEATGLALPIEDEPTYGVVSIALVSGSTDFYRVTLKDGSSFTFSEEYAPTQPAAKIYTDVSGAGHVVTRKDIEAASSRMLADDSDYEHVVGKPLGVTVPWSVGDAAMDDEDWFSVTVRIYLEGWQNLDPTLESAIKIESNSLTAAQIASDGDIEKAYIASDDLKVYTYDGEEWQGVEADPNKVYVISNSFYSYSKGGLNEISPADRGSHYVEVEDFVEDDDIAGMVGMADGDAYLASDTMKLYVYSTDDGNWTARDLEMNEVVVHAADGKVYAKQAGEFKARVGGNIWDDKEYVGASFNVGMTFAVDAY